MFDAFAFFAAIFIRYAVCVTVNLVSLSHGHCFVPHIAVIVPSVMMPMTMVSAK